MIDDDRMRYIYKFAFDIDIDIVAVKAAKSNTPFTRSSNHRANIQQMHSKYTCPTCALIARCLFDVNFARCLLDDCLIV